MPGYAAPRRRLNRAYAPWEDPLAQAGYWVQDAAGQWVRRKVKQAVNAGLNQMDHTLRRKYRSYSGYDKAYALSRVKHRTGRIQEFKRTRTQLREIKNSDVSITNFTADNIALVNGIAQGDTEGTRDGRYIMPQKMELMFDASYVAAQENLNFRILCVVDTQANGAAPSITDILTSSSETSFYNLDNAARFRICFDKTYYHPQADASTASRKIVKRIACDVSKCGTVAYSDSGATVTSIVKNACYFLYVGNAPSSTSCVVRYTFIDQ